jgi:hypothetical protein
VEDGIRPTLVDAANGIARDLLSSGSLDDGGAAFGDDIE